MSWRWPLPETPATPTISPPRIDSDTSRTAGWPPSSSALSFSMSSRGAPNSPVRGGCTVSSSAPIIVRAMASGLRSLTCPCPASLPRRRMVTSSAKAITSRNLWVIIRMVSSPRSHHAAQHAEHLVGLAGREHRGRLVEDEEAALEIELLEDFAFLPLAGGDRRHLGVERHAKRHARQKFLERLALARPVDDRRHVVARQHEILRDRHRRHQREVLIDHAEAERVRGARIADDLLRARRP